MSFSRQPLLETETEKKLIEQFHPLWQSGDSYKKIAETLRLGEENTIFAQIKPEYLRYFRMKFEGLHQKEKLKREQNPSEYKDKPPEFPLSFPARKKPSFAKGESRYNCSPEELMRRYGLISPTKFINLLNEKLPWDSRYCCRVRSFLTVLYWSPLRSSEIYSRTRNDFEITDKKIIIHLLRKKKRRDPKKKYPDEPVFIQRAFPYAEIIVTYLQSDEWKNPVPKKQLTENEIKKIKNEIKSGKRKKGDYHFINNRPWRITGQTARRYVKEVFGESYYPHFFRFRFLTEGANDSETSLAELLSKSKLSLSALQTYLKTEAKMQDRFDRRKLKRLKKEGLVQ